MLTLEAGRKERAPLPASLRNDRALLPASLRDVPGLLGVLAPGCHNREQKATPCCAPGGPCCGPGGALLLVLQAGGHSREAGRRAQQGERRAAAGRTPQQTRPDASADRRRPAARRPDPDLGRVGRRGPRGYKGKRRVLRKARSEPRFETQCWGGFFRGRVPKKQDNKQGVWRDYLAFFAYNESKAVPNRA